MTVFCYVGPCIVAKTYRRFRSEHLQFLQDYMAQHVKIQSPSNRITSLNRCEKLIFISKTSCVFFKVRTKFFDNTERFHALNFKIQSNSKVTQSTKNHYNSHIFLRNNSKYLYLVHSHGLTLRSGTLCPHFSVALQLTEHLSVGQFPVH